MSQRLVTRKSKVRCFMRATSASILGQGIPGGYDGRQEAAHTGSHRGSDDEVEEVFDVANPGEDVSEVIRSNWTRGQDDQHCLDRCPPGGGSRGGGGGSMASAESSGMWDTACDEPSTIACCVHGAFEVWRQVTCV